MPVDGHSLERLVPDDVGDESVMEQETLHLHLERYAFAAKYIKPGRFLDIACGVGYGTRILFDKAPRPVQGFGVDISQEAIAYARKRYKVEGLRYLVHDAMTLPKRKAVKPESFETIVSLETLEHLPQPRSFVTTIRPLLAPGGTWIASVPVTPSLDANPHHFHDFTEKTFLKLFRGTGLQEVERMEQVQPYSPFSLLSPNRKGRTEGIRTNLLLWYLRNPTYALKRAWTFISEGCQNRYLTIALRD